jgi:hypothetical protein
MRTLLLFVIASGWINCSGQQTSAVASPCLERMKLPDYPPLPLVARIHGEVLIDVHVSEKLTFSDMEIQGTPHPLLVGAVWEALQNSTFAPKCRGQLIRLVFAFVIEGKETKTPQAASLYFSYPNRFWIVAHPVQPQMQP